MKFLSAQPDEPYFLWQLQVQLSNFARLGIEDDLIVLLGVRDKPSPQAEYIKARTKAQVHFIPDTRKNRSYAPSIQFHLYAKYFTLNKIGEPYMLVDTDVVFDKMPLLHRLIEDDVVYMSNTKSYIGYEYVLSKGEQQLAEMAKLVGVTPEQLKANDEGAGGAQTIMKGCENPAFWMKVEHDAVALYQYMSARESKWTGEGYPIQRWTAGMWAFLWNIWKSGIKTSIVPEMDFCWGSDPITSRKPIVHMAGVTADMASTHFFKGQYITAHPFDANLKCESLCNTISDLYVCEILNAKNDWATR